jgi:carbamoyl-phosphate synthase large subunit
MINCNPETVSTDFDTADKLYFEPAGNISMILSTRETRRGNCTAWWTNGFKISRKLSKYGIKIIGTSFDALDLAEDRGVSLNC